MAARYVGLTSTFGEQRLVINAIAEDVDSILTSGAPNAFGLVGTPSINVDVVTANRFIGNITGIATNAYGLVGTPSINVNVVTANSINSNLTGNVIGNVTGNVVGNLTGTASTSTVSTNAYGLTGVPNITVGVATATSFVGNLIGIANTATNAYGLTGVPNITVGFATATRFTGDVTGNVTGNLTGNVNGSSTNAYGLIGVPNINVGNINAVDAAFSGKVSIAGTLTYEDVTNVDSVGLITARTGIEIGSSVSIASTLGLDGSAIFSGIVTASGFSGDGSGLTGIINGVGIQSAGTNVASGIVTTLNFIGSGNTFSYDSETQTINITIQGSAGGGGEFDITSSLFI